MTCRDFIFKLRYYLLSSQHEMQRLYTQISLLSAIFSTWDAETLYSNFATIYYLLDMRCRDFIFKRRYYLLSSWHEMQRLYTQTSLLSTIFSTCDAEDLSADFAAIYYLLDLWCRGFIHRLRYYLLILKQPPSDEDENWLLMRQYWESISQILIMGSDKRPVCAL